MLLRILKPVLAVVTGIFVLSAIYISVLIVELQDRLGHFAQYNTSFAVGKGASEFIQLEQHLSEFGDPNSSVDQETVELRYEILLSRVAFLTRGLFEPFLQDNPDGQETLRRLEEALATIEPLIKNLERPGHAQRALQILKPFESKFTQLAAVAHSHGTSLVIAHQRRLIQLHWLFSGVAFGLILTGLALIALLKQNNRLLKQARQELQVLAHHDSLTGLANRVLLRDRLEQALASDTQHDGGIAVLYLDLDRFKDVNDTFGHEMGDALLEAVAERLRDCVRSGNEACAGNLIARLGGDEFAILQTAVSQPDDCVVLASRLIAAVGAPFHLNGQEIVVGTSIGISIASNRDVTSSQLLKQVDLALYRAKADGRGTFRFFEPAMEEQLQARRALEIDLRKALANNEFELFYQPQVSIAANEIIGFEALLRWRHPERGFVSPAEFIPIAEDIGLIVPLGEWIVEQACREAAAWPRDLKVAVNLSSVQFRNKGLVQCISRALAQSGIAPIRLELEITESVLLQDNEATVVTLHELRRLGVHIALDDFGTGYSSLSYLHNFPFDKIKIDQSFVRGLSSRANSLAIVQSIVSLSTNLGMSTVAEGVETEDQYHQIRAAGCAEIQGYYFGRPKPARELVFSLHEQVGVVAA